MSDTSRTYRLPVRACSQCGEEFFPPGPNVTVCSDCVRRGDEAAAQWWRWSPAKKRWAIRIGCVLLALLAFILWVRWAFHSDADGRERMLLTWEIIRDNKLCPFSEAECYVDDRGDAIWHGKARAFNFYGECTTEMIFLDGRFGAGWEMRDGKKHYLHSPKEIFSAKKWVGGIGLDLFMKIQAQEPSE